MEQAALKLVASTPNASGGAPSCRLCAGATVHQFSKLILGKHEVGYWRCTACACLQTDHPHWLEESYRAVHSATDTGMVARTWQMAQTTSLLLRLAGVKNTTPCVDWGGGNGLFCRMMRDQGYDFVNDDKYAEPFYCAGFTRADRARTTADIVTSFEVFEHLPDPGLQLSEILKLNPKLWIFSTQLYTGQDQTWRYLSPRLGRHVFFYSEAGLNRFAARHGFALLKGREMHLLIRKSGQDYLKDGLRRRLAAQLLAGAKPLQFAAALNFLSRQRQAWRHWRTDSQTMLERQTGPAAK